MPDARVRPVHRTHPNEPCLTKRWCPRRHWWQAVCGTHWTETYTRKSQAERALYDFHLEDHGGDDD